VWGRQDLNLHTDQHFNFQPSLYIEIPFDENNVPMIAPF